MNRVNWTAVSVFVIIVLLVVVIGVSTLSTLSTDFLGGDSYWGMGPGMMGGFAPFGWLMMIFMMLFPLSFLALTVLGIIWLVRALTGGLGSSVPPTEACPSCGRDLQADWRNCPYCGAVISNE